MFRSHRFPIGLAVVLCLLISALELRAQPCQAQVQASLSGNNILITATKTGTCIGGSLDVYVNSSRITSKSCGTSSTTCTASVTAGTLCLPANVTITAVANCLAQIPPSTSCTPQPPVFASTTLTLGGPPTLALSTDGPNSSGGFVTTAAYNLPRTQSKVFEFWQQAPWGVIYENPRGDNQTGTWTFNYATSCWPEGAYAMNGRVTTCTGEIAEAATVLSVPSHKPSAAVVPDLSDPLNPKAKISWSFPNTQIGVGTNRWVGVYWEPEGSLLWQTGTTVDQNGNVTISLPACVVGSKDSLRAVATVCGDAEGISEGNDTYVGLPKCEVTCDTCSNGQVVKTKCDSPAECAGDPVRVTSGNMRMSDRDTLPGGGLVRTYDSKRPGGMLGQGWMSIFDSWLKASGITGPRNRVLIETEGGKRVVFVTAGAGYRQIWPVPLSSSGTLVYDASNSEYLHREGPGSMIRVFRNGRLAALRSATGAHEITISRDAAGLPTRVADSRGGWAWNINTGNGRVQSIAVEGRSDLVWSYGRDGSGNLTSVIGPFGTWRTYTYGPSGMRTAHDGAGQLIESHEYNAAGLAITSAGDAGDITAFAYDLPGRVPGELVSRVTYAAGRTTLTYSRYIAGKMRTVEIDGSCDCGAEDSVFVYDAAGHLVRQQNALGWITTREISGDRLIRETSTQAPSGCDPATDASRCHLTPDALANANLVATPETRSASWEYLDANWPNRPSRVTTSSVLAPGEANIEELTFDPVTGVVLVDRVTGWTADGGGSPRQQTRTSTTALYDGAEPAAFVPGPWFEPWATLPQPAREVRQIDGPRTDAADVTTFVYYPIHDSVPALLRGRRAAVRNAAGHVTRFESYDIFGNLTRSVDPNGTITEMTYDALGRLTATTMRAGHSCASGDPACSVTRTLTYAGAGPLTLETHPDAVSRFEYDDRGRIRTISRGPSASDLRERIETTYDPATGHKSLERTLAFEGGAWVEKRRESFAYDPSGNLSRLTHGDSTFVEYAYGVNAQLLSVRDERHATPNTSYQYDAEGRVAAVRQLLGGSAIATSYEHDLDGNLTSVTDPNGNVTSYVYDDFGQLLRQDSPVSGQTSYAFDLAGQLLTTIDANGAETTRTYDVLGRVTSSVAQRAGESETVTWSYDSAPFGVGRLAAMIDPTGGTEYEYEHRGFLTKEIKHVGAEQYVTRFGYDASGNRSRMVYPSGRVVDSQFDFAGRPLSMATGGTALVTSAKYLPYGPATEIVFGNGTRKTMTFDARFRPIVNRLDGPAGTIASYLYGHDDAGNITSIHDALDPTFNREFGYDDLNRLVIANSGTSLWGAGSYNYDAMGNLLSSSLGASRSAAFTYEGTTPKLTGATENAATRAITYDAAGNEQTVGGESFAYSARNSLAGAGDHRYAYDGRGIRTITTRPQRIELVSVVIAPPAVTGGTTAEGVVLLNAPAPAGGVVVTLASSSVHVVVPTQIVVDAGHASATFVIETTPVAADVMTTMTAMLEAAQRQATLHLLTPALTDFSFDASSLYGGSSANGTISISGPAAGGGKTLTLTSSSASLSVPASVAIAAGQTTASFAVSATAVETETEAVVTVTDGSRNQTAGIRILSPELIGFTVTPSTVVGGEAATAEAQINAPAAAGGASVAISTSDQSLVPSATLVVPAGTSQGTASLPTAPVAANTPVVVSATRNGIARSSILTLSPPPVTIASLTIAPPSLIGSNDATGTITLTDPAPALGIEIELLSSDGAVNVPAFVQIAPGQSQATFPIATSVVAVSTPVTITATHAATTKSALLTLQPPAGNSVSSVSATPAFITGGFSSQGTVTLATPSTDNGGSDVVLSSSDGALIVPARVTVKKNQTSANFTISTNVVTAPRSVTLTASHGGMLRRITVIVAPQNAVTLASFTINPPRVIGGNPTSGTVVLSAPAPFGGAAVAVSTKRRNMVTVPSTVLIAEGATTATFPIATEPIHGNKDRAAEIDATYNGIARTATLTIAPSLMAESSVRNAIAQCASLAIGPCLTVAGLKVATDAITATESRYSFYSPELHLLAETAYSTESAKTIDYEYIWFGGQPVAQIETATNTVQYYFNDHLGAPLLTTDGTGAIDWRVEREPYGEIYSVRVGADRHQPLSFPGQEDDDTSELTYNIFRWYRSSWGRYTQEDRIPQPLHLYDYVVSNPLRYVDPFGLVKVVYNYHHTTAPMAFKNGCTSYKLVDFSHTCKEIGCDLQTKQSIWKLQFRLEANFIVYINSALGDEAAAETLEHEDEHVGTATNNLNNTLSYVLPFEKKKYSSKAQCEAGADAALTAMAAGKGVGSGQAGVDDYLGFVVGKLLSKSCP